MCLLTYIRNSKIFLQLKSLETAQYPVYEVKCLPFKWGFSYVKMLPCPSKPDIHILTPVKGYKMWYWMKFYHKKVIIKRSKGLSLLSKFAKQKVWLLTFMMPIQIKLHKILNLKALNSGKDISGWQGFCSTITWSKTHLKSPHFTSLTGYFAFHVIIAVYGKPLW